MGEMRANWNRRDDSIHQKSQKTENLDDDQTTPTSPMHPIRAKIELAIPRQVSSNSGLVGPAVLGRILRECGLQSAMPQGMQMA